MLRSKIDLRQPSFLPRPRTVTETVSSQGLKNTQFPAPELSCTSSQGMRASLRDPRTSVLCTCAPTITGDAGVTQRSAYKRSLQCSTTLCPCETEREHEMTTWISYPCVLCEYSLIREKQPIFSYPRVWKYFFAKIGFFSYPKGTFSYPQKLFHTLKKWKLFSYPCTKISYLENFFHTLIQKFHTLSRYFSYPQKTISYPNL